MTVPEPFPTQDFRDAIGDNLFFAAGLSNLLGQYDSLAAQVTGLTLDNDALRNQVAGQAIDISGLKDALDRCRAENVRLAGVANDVTIDLNVALDDIRVLKAALATKDETIAANNTEIARLRAALTDCQNGGTPSTNRFYFGRSRPTALDPMAFNRVYVEAGDALPGTHTGPLTAVTWKGTRTKPQIVAFLKTRRPNEVVGPQHEAEDDMETWLYGTATDAPQTKGLNPALWRQQMVLLCECIVELGLVGVVKVFGVIMEYSIAGAPERRKNIVTKEMFTPFVVTAMKNADAGVGIDVYAGKKAAEGGPDRLIPPMYENVVNLINILGLKHWGVFETGAGYGNGSVDSMHADWWKRNLDYLGTMANPPYCFIIWNRPPIDSTNPNTFAIDHIPAVMAVFRDAIAKYGK